MKIDTWRNKIAVWWKCCCETDRKWAQVTKYRHRSGVTVQICIINAITGICDWYLILTSGGNKVILHPDGAVELSSWRQECEMVCADSINSNPVSIFWWVIIYKLSVPFFSWVLLMLLTNWYIIRCVEGCMLSWVECVKKKWHEFVTV